MMVQETKQATVKGTTVWVTKLSYTRDEALMDKVRAAGAWERGEISSRTLAAIKAHISRRTSVNACASQQAVALAAPVVKKVSAPAPVVDDAKKILDASNGKVIEAIEAVTHEAFERRAQEEAAYRRQHLDAVRQVWSLGECIDPIDIFLARLPVPETPFDYDRNRKRAFDQKGLVLCALVARDHMEWVRSDFELSEYVGIIENADDVLLTACRERGELNRQDMIAKFLSKVLPILSARDDLFGVSQRTFSGLDTAAGECCFKFHFGDGSTSFEAQTMIVESCSSIGNPFTRYPLTFHEIKVDGKKVGHPSLETATDALLGGRRGSLITALKTVISDVSDEGLMRLLTLANQRDEKVREITVRKLKEEKRWHGFYMSEKDKEYLEWMTPKRRAKFRGDLTDMARDIQKAADLAYDAFLALRGVS